MKMGIDALEKREQMLQLREKLLEVEENRIEEADEILRNVIDEAARNERSSIS